MRISFKRNCPVKKNLCLILSTLLVSFTAQLAFAYSASDMPPQPNMCPAVGAIKPIGVSHATRQIAKMWFAGRRSNLYGTSDQWTFIVGNIPAKNKTEAFNAAMVGLKTLSFMSGPFYDVQWNRWFCLYNTANGLPALAINPTIDSSTNDSPALFAQV